MRAARERLGWSREALAFHSDLSWSAIAQIESGRRQNPRPGTLAALAAALGLTIDYLVNGGPASPPILQHQALIYASDEELLETAGPLLAGGLERSEAVLAVTRSENIELLREYLGPGADRVEFVDSAGRMTSPGAALDGYRSFASSRIKAGAPWVRVLAEPIWAGRSDSELQLWTRFESFFNLVFASWPMTVLCPYDERSVPREIVGQARITHPETIERGEMTSSPDYADPGHFVFE